MFKFIIVCLKKPKQADKQKTSKGIWSRKQKQLAA